MNVTEGRMSEDGDLIAFQRSHRASGHLRIGMRNLGKMPQMRRDLRRYGALAKPFRYYASSSGDLADRPSVVLMDSKGIDSRPV